MSTEDYAAMAARFDAWSATEPPLARLVPGSEFARFLRWCAKDLAQSMTHADASPTRSQSEREVDP